jgi:hypothetical protein
MEARPVLILSFIVVLLMMLTEQAFAYDDSLGAHSKINSIALKNFQTEIMPGDPNLKNAYLDNTPCTGIAWDPTDGDRINPPEIAVQRVKPLKFWVIDGGYSADEPEGTMALCHFYDPTQPTGKGYLTDQQFIVNVVKNYNSEYANPEIDAVEWAFHGDQYGTVFDQQYSWDQGKGYLKNALESPDPNNVNYGKAWRSLGETMHLMADMTVPAHVRNDGHAKALNDPDPYESSTTWEFIDQNKGFVPASDINYDQNPEKLMISVATYTNSHFLSKDTIPLPTGISSPWHKYSLPSVEGLTPSPMGYLNQDINGERVRIARTRSLTSYLFGTGKQQYMIDNNVCDDQRKVLIPTAIKADEMLVSDFLPRFKVTAQVNPANIGDRYTMIGGIKGIDKGEWLQISSVKIRNGARIIVTDAKTCKETKVAVKLIDPSGDFNSFSYDFNANPGDTVRLEYDLGGYVVKSDDTMILDTKSGERKPDRTPRKVTVPPAPAPLHTKTENYDSGGKTIYSYYETENQYGYPLEILHGNHTTYDGNGRPVKECTFAFNKLIGYDREYTNGKLDSENYYGDNGIMQYTDEMVNLQWIRRDLYDDGSIKDKFEYYIDGSLRTYTEYPCCGGQYPQATLFETYKNGKLVKVKTYRDGKWL